MREGEGGWVDDKVGGEVIRWAGMYVQVGG